MAFTSPKSSPARRTALPSSPAAGPIFTSPIRPELSEFLTSARNSPEAHKRGLEEAKKNHERVLKAALHALELHRISEERLHIELEEKRRKERLEEERRRLEEERRAEVQRLQDEARLQALKSQPIPKPPTPSLPTPQISRDRRDTATTPASAVTGTSRDTAQAQQKLNGVSTANESRTTTLITSENPAINDASTAAAKQDPLSLSLQPAVPAVTPKPLQPPATRSTDGGGSPMVPVAARPTVTQEQVLDRHIQIHKRLKQLRSEMQRQAHSNPTLKAAMGEMRREIRKSVGQLTSGGLKENKIPVSIISDFYVPSSSK
jgi:nucleoporin GLE1